MQWLIIDSGRLPPEQIMAKDARLLEELQFNPQPILHLYEWEGDCLTYGYFTQPAQHLDLDALKECQLQMARRPTGGGIIFHLTDFAFSILIPAIHPHFSFNSLENYAYINGLVAQALAHLNQRSVQAKLWVENERELSVSTQFCMARPTQYDLIVDERKVGGAAQRKTKWGFLHQGSLSLMLPPFALLNKVIRDKSVLDKMQKNSYPLFGIDVSVKQLQEKRDEVKEAIKGLREISRKSN